MKVRSFFVFLRTGSFFLNKAALRFSEVFPPLPREGVEIISRGGPMGCVWAYKEAIVFVCGGRIAISRPCDSDTSISGVSKVITFEWGSRSMSFSQGVCLG